MLIFKIYWIVNSYVRTYGRPWSTVCTFLLFFRFTVMKYKVLLCLLWELTTPVPVEGRLADDL